MGSDAVSDRVCVAILDPSVKQGMWSENSEMIMLLMSCLYIE